METLVHIESRLPATRHSHYQFSWRQSQKRNHLRHVKQPLSQPYRWPSTPHLNATVCDAHRTGRALPPQGDFANEPRGASGLAGKK